MQKKKRTLLWKRLFILYTISNLARFILYFICLSIQWKIQVISSIEYSQLICTHSQSHRLLYFVFTQISYSVFCIGTSTAWQHTNSHQQGKSRWSITCQNRITTAYITYGNKVGPRNNWQHRTQSIGHHHRPKQKDQCNQERNLTTTAGCHQTEVGEVKRNLILERSSRITDKNSEL